MDYFTEEELLIAKEVDLCDVAASLGYTIKRVGSYNTLKEMDSIRIYNRRTWFRWSRKDEPGVNGGSQIDFLRVFQGMSIREAVLWLLDFAGYRRYDAPYQKQNIRHISVPEKKIRKPFVLPDRADGCFYIQRYLTEERMINEEIVRQLIEIDLIYEEKNYHNIVFLGVDKQGVPRFASRRGVFDNGEKPFKCDVAGADKSYGFNIITESDEIAVFEGAIDLLSYADLYGSFDINMVALGMLSDEPLNTILKEHPNITKIRVCLDNDEPGREAAKRIVNKYRMLGYEVLDFPPREEFKDYNDYLKACKLCRNCEEKQNRKSR